MNHTKSILAAGAAALALVAAPAAFGQGQGQGNGKGNDGVAAAAKVKAGHDKHAGMDHSVHAQERREEKRERAQDRREDMRERASEKAEERQERRSERAEERRERIEDRIEERRDRVEDRIDDRIDRRGDRRAHRLLGRREDLRDVYLDEREYRDRRAFLRSSDTRGLIDGCPPGLAKKNNGCLPPGQAKKRYRDYDPGLFGLGGSGGRYLYQDGYLMRYDGDRLAGFLPLLGGALGIGNVWPSYYQPQPISDYYARYYGFDDPRSYRYADNVIYRVDPETAAIRSIAALLTGDDFTIGQPVPSGYDVYNVPYEYRDRYYDTPDARYRYSDGFVYEIDPKTALVVAAIDLLI